MLGKRTELGSGKSYSLEKKEEAELWQTLPMCVDSDFLDLTDITRTILITVLLYQNVMLEKKFCLSEDLANSV